jgi:hypothetical protein
MTDWSHYSRLPCFVKRSLTAILIMALPDCQIRQSEPGFGNPGKAKGRFRIAGSLPNPWK